MILATYILIIYGSWRFFWYASYPGHISIQKKIIKGNCEHKDGNYVRINCLLGKLSKIKAELDFIPANIRVRPKSRLLSLLSFKAKKILKKKLIWI